MSKRLLAALVALPLALPLAGTAQAKRSPADQALYERARKECSSNSYPDGSHPYINYKNGWFRCVQPKIHNR